MKLTGKSRLTIINDRHKSQIGKGQGVKVTVNGILNETPNTLMTLFCSYLLYRKDRIRLWSRPVYW